MGVGIGVRFELMKPGAKLSSRCPLQGGPDFGQADIMCEIQVIYSMLEGLLSSLRD